MAKKTKQLVKMTRIQAILNGYAQPSSLEQNLIAAIVLFVADNALISKPLSDTDKIFLKELKTEREVEVA